jgi:hypothetical protein
MKRLAFIGILKPSMNLNNFPVGIADWSQIPESTHEGKSGLAIVRSHQLALA